MAAATDAAAPVCPVQLLLAHCMPRALPHLSSFRHPELQHLGQPERFDFAFERMAPGELGGCRLDAVAALRPPKLQRGSDAGSNDGSSGSSGTGKATAAA